MKAWLLWILLCVLVQGGVAAIITGVAVHSPHYNARSVGMGALTLLGVEILLSAVFVAADWWDACKRMPR